MKIELKRVAQIIVSLAFSAFAVFVLSGNSEKTSLYDKTTSYERTEVPDPYEAWQCQMLAFADVNKPAEEPAIWEENENELIEAALLARSTVIEGCLITHYCAEKYPHICGNGDGLTATGVEARPGVVAVDPNVIPYGSTVMVDYGDGELVYYVASDCGSSIKGNHIDVCCWTHQEAKEKGKTTATVYWCTEG